MEDGDELVVRRPLVEVLDRIEQGVSNVATSLTMKADRTDIGRLHSRLDEHDERIRASESSLSSLKGWIAGAMAVVGLLSGGIGALVAHFIGN